MENLMEKIVSLSKRRGFLYQSSEIYGGFAGFWDYGPLGAQLSYNIKDLWWKTFVSGRDDIYGISSTNIMPKSVWEASGHLEGFTDPMVLCKKCKKRFRADHLNDASKCPECSGELGEVKTFNLMFPVEVGSTGEKSTTAYLRGENAQGMFVNFKNVIDSFHPKLPFGLAQVGRSFRNEIAPRDFLFRAREFDLAEFEYFVREDEWEKWFSYWEGEMENWIDLVGIDKNKVHKVEIGEDDRAHYSKRTIDFEFDYPFGQKELYGLVYRTDHDLKLHMEHSGVSLEYTDEATGERFIPHVVEPTFGIGRTILAVLLSAYTEDEMGGEKRAYLKLKPTIAPIKAAVFPLVKNKENLVKKAQEVYANLKKEIPSVMWDDNGNIGKRYRRQDEIGTPFCITVDHDTLEDDSVTVRDRDTGEQERISTKELVSYIEKAL
ncbi:MAG: glycine--tRNA ligase [Candidatus Pacebacteria bacterium]|nr:glycine--tRNA ligase [bacterium]MDP6527399.1 glycine--tRNA ligase [Candidatus Paceibacterota bacterium]MDP6659525.1 glycine--tRNA ligase [Candidatus Paceibacterota bacterium]|tara:strand:- start:23262 stop:24563 length:1302 start_codon:yes stop_codon:yes gene_type:complete